MKVRTDVAAMLKDGHSHIHIMRTLHVSRPTVLEARKALGMPAPTRGRHLRWTSSHNTGGAPMLGHDSRQMSAMRVAFRLRYDREPEGRVLTNCGYDGCVALDHVEDRPMREQYTAIFGGAS